MKPQSSRMFLSITRQAQEQAKEPHEVSLNGYKRTSSSCVTGRGYTVG